jgi:iron complex outermembrane receptor protein
MSSNMLKGMLVATSALCAFQAAPALAQDLIGEVVVTARRTEERLQDVPISVTVFSQEQIAKQNIVNMTDLALYTPSLGTTNVLGNSQTTFSLRGFNQELTTSATVGVFFADVVAPRGASNQQPAGDGAGPGSFFDLQNVQILKGPQGTLFGRNTTGGAILLVPQKPSDQLEGYVEASAGNYQMKRLQGVFNAPLGDKGRVRIGLDRQYRDGYVRNLSPIGPSRFNDIDYTAGRFSLVLEPTDSIENYTVASYVHSKTNGEVNSVINAEPTTLVPTPAGTLPFANGSPIVGAFAYLAGRELARYGRDNFYSLENNMPNPRTELTQWQVINTTTWRASDNLTVKNIVSYAQLKYDLVNPVVGNYFDLADFNQFGQAFMNLIVNSRFPPGVPTPPARSSTSPRLTRGASGTRRTRTPSPKSCSSRVTPTTTASSGKPAATTRTAGRWAIPVRCRATSPAARPCPSTAPTNSSASARWAARRRRRRSARSASTARAPMTSPTG